MAKRKKASKVQKRGGKAGKVAKAAKRTVAKAKPKRAKKAAHKETAAPAVETLADTSEIPEESAPKPPSLI